MRARFWVAVLAGMLAVAALCGASSCSGRDAHRDRCERQGGTVGAQYDRAGNVKAHTCTVDGRTVDVWSLPAPMPQPQP